MDAAEQKTKMLHLAKKLVVDESGQDLAEYGIALAVIAVAAAAAAVAMRGDVQALWENGQAAVHSAL